MWVITLETLRQSVFPEYCPPSASPATAAVIRADGAVPAGRESAAAQPRPQGRTRPEIDAPAILNSPQSASRPENPLAPGFVFALQGLRRLLSRSAIVAQISQSGLYGGYHPRDSSKNLCNAKESLGISWKHH